MAQSILELIFKTSKQGQGGKAAAAELKELKGTVGEVSSGLLGFNVSSLTAVGAVVAVGAAVGKAVTDYQNYAESMRGLAAITGTGVEETSRLVQAFDDMGISQEKVQSTMESAARKGFVMSIENVAKLADEYNQLGTQEEKNALLTDKLGKGGLAMAKAFEKGGKAIKDAAAAQADGMIITEENSKAADDLRIAQDNLNDSWQAMSNSVAKFVVPALTEVLDLINDGTSRTQLMAKVVAATGQNLGMMTRAEQDAAIATYEYTLSLTTLNTQQDVGAKVVTETVVPALNDYLSISQQINQVTKDNTVGALGASSAQMEYVDSISKLEGATKGLQDAQEGWMKGAGGDVKSELEAAGLKGDAYTKALAAIDTQMGTNYVQEQAYKDNVKAIVEQYAKGGTDALPTFTAGLASMKTTWMENDEQVQKMRTTVINLQSSLDLLVSKSYNVAVNMITGVSGTTSNGPSSGKISSGNSADTYVDPLKGVGGANGLDFVVPPGYPNDSYPIRVQSGEHVLVTPAGQTTNMGNVTIIVNGAGDPKAVADAISLRLASYGKKYQGS